MELKLFILMVSYFLVGGILICLSNKKKDETERRNTWLKFVTYFAIVLGIFSIILIKPALFMYFVILVIILGYFEILRLTLKHKKIKVGLAAIILITIVFYGFFEFSLLKKQVLYNVLLIVFVFDGFSQATGQIYGKKKLFPQISPNKTAEGLIGGYIVSVATALITHSLFGKTIIFSILSGLIISSTSLVGDLSASFLKRKFGIKDFSRVLPGHGGILDRFDSIIFSGFFVFILNSIFPEIGQ